MGDRKLQLLQRVAALWRGESQEPSEDILADIERVLADEQRADEASGAGQNATSLSETGLGEANTAKTAGAETLPGTVNGGAGQPASSLRPGEFVE